MGHTRHLTVAVGLSAAYLLAAATLERGGLARSLFGNLAMVSVAALVVIGVARRRREWAGCQRLFWDTVALGSVFWLVGHLGWAYGATLAGRPDWLAWHTVFSLSGGTAPLLALIARPHRGVRQQAAAAVAVDLASYALLAGFIYSYFVLVPSVAGGRQAELTLLLSVQVFRFALMAGMCAAAVVARHTAWGPTYRLLAIGATAGVALRFITSRAIANGSYQPGTFYDAAWIVPFLFYLWALHRSPASPASDERDEPSAAGGFALSSAAPVLLIPLVGYASLPLQEAQPGGAAFHSLLTSMATVVGLGLLTLRLLVQRGELQRADARARLLAAATEQTGDLILIARADGAVQHANDAFLRAVGLNLRELSTLTFPQPMDSASVALVDQIPAELRERGVWRGTLRRRRPDGSTFSVSSTVVALRSAAGVITHFVAVERDATEELKLRDQLVHSERLSAVGELVAGVAHEINNPLQAIVGCVELMLEDLSNPALMRKDLEIVRFEAGRAGHIVRNLLSFVRHSAPDRMSEDLNDIVRRTAELRQYHLQQQNIELAVQCSPEPLRVLIDREEVQQVVLNLLLNAEHAIAAHAGHGAIVIRTARAGDRQVLDILDNGPGIRPEIRGRIFEPFFTTKEIGEGTGLGLSISHGIAVSHGGALELCESGEGACFRLWLPAHQPAQEAVTPRAPGSGDPLARVLVVDDEEPIRRLLSRLLDRRGYKVAGASTVEEAAASVATFRPGIVLCDVRMPDGGGMELYRRVREAHPDVAPAFIFISGDIASVQPLDKELTGVSILAKPFTAADLDAQLGRVVAARAH